MPRKTIILLIAILLLAILITGSLLGFYHRCVYQPTDPNSTSTISFTISPGTSGRTVINRLKEKNLIHCTLPARIFFRLQQKRGLPFEAGEYQISPSQSLKEIYQDFLHGTFDLKITIPEGKRLEEISEIAAQELNFTPEEFFSTAQASRGLLFPDTYLVPQSTNAEELRSLMVETFHQKVNADREEKFQEQNLTLYQAVTIASIVERETRNNRDRKLVAGILIKRLENDWRLEADATVQYAKANLSCRVGENCQWWPNNLTLQDLEIDSPYNTRKNAGLPPTPICSPGLNALQAVASPQKSPYWYYLSDENGQTYYSISYEEHLLKKSRYLGP